MNKVVCVGIGGWFYISAVLCLEFRNLPLYSEDVLPVDTSGDLTIFARSVLSFDIGKVMLE